MEKRNTFLVVKALIGFLFVCVPSKRIIVCEIVLICVKKRTKVKYETLSCHCKSGNIDLVTTETRPR